MTPPRPIPQEWQELLDDAIRCDGYAPCGDCEHCVPGGRPWREAAAEWRQATVTIRVGPENPLAVAIGAAWQKGRPQASPRDAEPQGRPGVSQNDEEA